MPIAKRIRAASSRLYAKCVLDVLVSTSLEIQYSRVADILDAVSFHASLDRLILSRVHREDHESLRARRSEVEYSTRLTRFAIEPESLLSRYRPSLGGRPGIATATTEACIPLKLWTVENESASGKASGTAGHLSPVGVRRPLTLAHVQPSPLRPATISWRKCEGSTSKGFIRWASLRQPSRNKRPVMSIWLKKSLSAK